VSHRNWVEFSHEAPTGEIVDLGRYVQARAVLRERFGITDRDAVRVLREAREARPWNSAPAAGGRVFALDVI
jgi:hypothetical protein